MKTTLRITLTGLAAGTLIAAIVAALMPLWLLVRVPDVVQSPELEAP